MTVEGKLGSFGLSGKWDGSIQTLYESLPRILLSADADGSPQ